jgi:hypothetical protein
MMNAGKPQIENDPGPWLAGVKTSMQIHYVVGPDPTKPGWSPYAAMAERWTKREDAVTAAICAVQSFKLSDGVPVLQNERQPFTGRGLECEQLEQKNASSQERIIPLTDEDWRRIQTALIKRIEALEAWGPEHGYDGVSEEDQQVIDGYRALFRKIHDGMQR